MLRQTISQKMLQKLSPQQIQLMKLLQVPTAVLEQRIKEELEANPALDEGEDHEDPYDSLGNDTGSDDADNDSQEGEESFELDDYINEYIEDDPSSYALKGENYAAEEEKTIPLAVENSFHDYLEQQLGMLNLSDETEQLIALQIIGSIDEDGYLRREPEAIIDDLIFSQNIFTTTDEVLRMLAEVQKFDPAGIGARDLQECLLIQMRQKLAAAVENSSPDVEIFQYAVNIIAHHFDSFSKKHFDKLQKHFGMSEEDLKDTIHEILKLNPKPASGYTSSGSTAVQYVVPDFLIFNRDGELELTLNSKNAPDLRINDQYVDMLKSFKSHSGSAGRKEKEAVMFIKQKIDSAKWFIDAIRQRQDTMYRTMYTIMQYQQDFFLTGDPKKLKPMILKDIADITGLDISTVSRVVSSKFVQTEFGTKRLKEFFSESMQTQSGEEVSTLEVKKILKDVIDAEDKRKPYSDEQLKDMLQEKGYNIARRTVAKYREQLNLPVARMRKEL